MYKHEINQSPGYGLWGDWGGQLVQGADSWPIYGKIWYIFFYFKHILLSSNYTDNGSDTSYKWNIILKKYKPKLYKV
jgi:hypothetical protein